MLLGRERERQEIGLVLDRARAGDSAVLGLVGEAGIGKTALLDWAADRGRDMALLRAAGIESEAEIPFASLLELLRPVLGLIERLPPPQAHALEEALAVRPGSAGDRFAVGAATLALVAAAAEERPVLVLVDDAQWLDGATAGALRFALRRLMADRVAALVAVRAEEPSLLDGARLPTLALAGLGAAEAAPLLGSLPPEAAERLHRATGGNPLALVELSVDPGELMLAPDGAPVIVSARVSEAFLRRAGGLAPEARRPLLLAAASDTGDLAVLARAASALAADLSRLTEAERAGLVFLRDGRVEFVHPLARSAIYTAADAEDRRAAHRALVSALPDRDLDRRAWHLAAAAVGPDDAASFALAQAGARALARSAYATAATAFERAGRLAVGERPRAERMLEAARAAWGAGQAEHAGALLAELRAATQDPSLLVQADALAGHMAVRCGPLMTGCELLLSAAATAEPEEAVLMAAEAAGACFYAGRPVALAAAAARAAELLPPAASARTRFVLLAATGIAGIIGGDGAAGAAALHEALVLAADASAWLSDVEMLPWLAIPSIFLREASAGRELLDLAVGAARTRTALGVLPFLLDLIGRDQATTDRWAEAEATYREAVELAREGNQTTVLVFGLAGLAWLLARTGRAEDCQAAATEALELTERTGARLHEVWALAALGELALAEGHPDRALSRFEAQRRLLEELAITDPDVAPDPELVEAYVRLGREKAARAVAAAFLRRAEEKAQPWSLARGLRAAALVAPDTACEGLFEAAIVQHRLTVDGFEEARTRLAFGERLRRARDRVRAREHLRAALDTFERLDARPWAERARSELAATGERLRRRDLTQEEELTPQELQIALLLAGGRTTREAAAALFLSPKTIEYHLRHVYLKLDVHTREDLAAALVSRHDDPVGVSAAPTGIPSPA